VTYNAMLVFRTCAVFLCLTPRPHLTHLDAVPSSRMHLGLLTRGFYTVRNS